MGSSMITSSVRHQGKESTTTPENVSHFRARGINHTSRSGMRHVDQSKRVVNASLSKHVENGESNSNHVEVAGGRSSTLVPKEMLDVGDPAYRANPDSEENATHVTNESRRE